MIAWKRSVDANHMDPNDSINSPGRDWPDLPRNSLEHGLETHAPLKCTKGATWVKPEKAALDAMTSIDKNATQQKKSEDSKPQTLLARPVYPGTRGTPHTNT